MMERSGLIEASRFSWKCGMAEKMGVSPLLFGFVNNPADEKIGLVQEALKKLFSYVYYCLTALQNDISDPFDSRVVRAHWIGNYLLKEVTLADLRKLFSSGMLNGLHWDKEVLAWYLTDLAKLHAFPHHSAYVLINEKRVPDCIAKDEKKRCKVDIGEIVDIGDSLRVKISDGEIESGFGFLQGADLEAGDPIIVHLGEARRFAGSKELARLQHWTECTLKCFSLDR